LLCTEAFWFGYTLKAVEIDKEKNEDLLRLMRNNKMNEDKNEEKNAGRKRKR